MNIRRIFNPWGEIARLESELSMSDASGYAQYRRAESLEKIRANLTAELSDLKARARFSDPKTGRMLPKGVS